MIGRDTTIIRVYWRSTSMKVFKWKNEWKESGVHFKLSTLQRSSGRYTYRADTGFSALHRNKGHITDLVLSPCNLSYFDFYLLAGPFLMLKVNIVDMVYKTRPLRGPCSCEGHFLFCTASVSFYCRAQALNLKFVWYYSIWKQFLLDSQNE